MKVRKIIFGLIDLALVLLFVYLLIFPQSASVPTRASLDFCLKTLIPSLFVYMVLAKTVITLPITDKLSRFLGYGPIALVIGLLCGAPIGAKSALSLYESGKINKKHAEYLCSFTNNASVSFVVGYVGAELFGDTKKGLMLFSFQVIASVATAFIIRRVMFGKTALPKVNRQAAKKVGLREAISDSASTMLNLCACVVFFIVAGSAVSNVLTLNVAADAALKSILEFSSGCAAAAKCGRYALPLTAFSIGFAGLSVAMQIKSVIAGKLSLRPYIAGKIISGAIITMLAVIFG